MNPDAANYFELRKISPETFGAASLPAYLRRALPADRGGRILDFGCGYGQLLQSLAQLGYGNACGVDIEPSALGHCRKAGLRVFDGATDAWAQGQRGTFSLAVACHVLEHLDKPDIIPTLRFLKNLLTADGALVVAVPNAQAHTGAYWAYEDFTHTTLFTSGSLYFVLRAAGFVGIELLDVDCTLGLPWHKRMLRKLLLGAYRANYRFWNRVTASYTHAPSPMIFSYEIKALARP